MDAQAMQTATAKAVKKKFGRKQLLPSKVVPHYPTNLEREYERVVNAYMGLFKTTFAEHLPGIRVLLEQGGAQRTDAADDEPQQEPMVIHSGAEVFAVSTALERAFAEVMNDFTERQGLFDLRGRIEKLSKLTRKLTVREWKRVVKQTLGINILEDYYSGAKFQTLIDKWVAENVALIKTIPQDTLGKMNDIVKQGYLQGATTKSIGKQIQEAYGVEKNHAQFIARDQMAKLNADITQQQQQDAGVNEYVWRTMNDSRVRASHAHLNDKRFRYGEPMSVDGTAMKPQDGRCDPGQDYQCRCMKLPIFDLDTVVLPFEKGGE